MTVIDLSHLMCEGDDGEGTEEGSESDGRTGAENEDENEGEGEDKDEDEGESYGEPRVKTTSTMLSCILLV